MAMLNGPASLVFDLAGNLFDADFFGNTIYKFAQDGSWTTFASSLNGPGNLAFDSAGNVFVADGNAYFNRPGPRIVESLEILAACVHPSAFPELIARHAGSFKRVTPDLRSIQFRPEGRN